MQQDDQQYNTCAGDDMIQHVATVIAANVEHTNHVDVCKQCKVGLSVIPARTLLLNKEQAAPRAFVTTALIH
jgi:hypothetical protein